MDETDKPDKGRDRIAKVIARAGLASRREAELWIAAGRVAVNGAVITSPAHNVTDRDRVAVDGEPLPERERTRLFLYHKPRGLITTHTDPRGRPTIFQSLPQDLPRLISVGRLDFNTEGLLLLTNDGALARVLELPATGWLRRYRVRAHGAVTQQQLDELRKGVTIGGIHYGAIEAAIERVQGSNLWLTFAIREGKNREVRNVLGELGLEVTRLIRVSFGPFQLKELAESAVEEVPTRVLREQLGARLVARSGADFSGPIAVPAPQSRDVMRRDVQPTATSDAARPSQEDRPRTPQRKFEASHRDNDKPRRREFSKSRTDEIGNRTGRRDHTKRFGQPAAPIAISPSAPAKDGQRKTMHRKPTGHAWGAHDEGRPKKLRREFHGSRRDADKPRRQPTAEAQSGEIMDRKGRRVHVERFARPPQEPPKTEAPKRGRRGRRSSPDRGSGPRPHQPRGRR